MARWSALLCLLVVLVCQLQRAASQTAAAPPAAIPQLPPLTVLPRDCGFVAQVLRGNTCESISHWAGISLEQFQNLSPLLLCGEIDLLPGSPVCVGDNLSFCSNHLIFATQKDSCASISSAAGTIVNINGLHNTSCSDLAAASGVPVCVNPDISKCQRDTICDVAINADMQALLAFQPDFCSILAECKASPELTAVEGKSSLALTIASRTSEVEHAAARCGHPALDSLAAAWAAGQPAGLRVTLTPDWFADGGQTCFEFIEVISSGNRKLKANVYIPRTYYPTGFIRVPHYWYY